MRRSHSSRLSCKSTVTVVKSQELMKGEQSVTVSHISRLVQTEKDWRAMTNVAKPRGSRISARQEKVLRPPHVCLSIRCDYCGLRCEHYLTANHSRLILRVTVVSSRCRLLQLMCGPWFDNWDRRRRRYKPNSCNRVVVIRTSVIRKYASLFCFIQHISRDNSSAKRIVQPTLKKRIRVRKTYLILKKNVESFLFT